MTAAPPTAVHHDGPSAIVTMQLAPHNLLSTELMDAADRSAL